VALDTRATRRPNGRRARVRDGELTAFFTRSPLVFSIAGVMVRRAYEVGHMSPSSTFAASSKPKVA
jgi:hypothetical protein